MYEGITPTGKTVVRTMIQIFRVADGKIQEEWSEGGSLSELVV
jgi:predicted ester cyclase